jgi:hypothetical protein
MVVLAAGAISTVMAQSPGSILSQLARPWRSQVPRPALRQAGSDKAAAAANGHAATTADDLIAIVKWLAKRDDVDSRRIAVVETARRDDRDAGSRARTGLPRWC